MFVSLVGAAAIALVALAVPHNALLGRKAPRAVDAGAGEMSYLISSIRTSLNVGSHQTAAEPDQAFFDDLKVEAGEIIEGDVVIYDGNARIASGGHIDGNLVVYSGKVEIDPGGSVDGNLSAFAGDVRVAGTVGGDLTVWSGDVDLKSSAQIDGDISVLNGNVDREPGASVGGNIVKGPNLELPPVPAPFKFTGPPDSLQNNIVGAGQSMVQRLISFLLRMMTVILLAALIGAVAWLIARTRPTTLLAMRSSLVAQPAFSFVIGVLTNAVLLISGAFFVATICLSPLALVAFLLLVVLDVAGLVVIASLVGERVSERLDLSVKWEYGVGISAAVMVGALGFLWAMGGCFRIFGFAGVLIVSSVGAGAIILPYLRKSAGPPIPASSQPVRTDSSAVASPIVPITGGAESTVVRPDVEDADSVREVAAVGEVSVDSQEDDFTRIRGFGPVATARLNAAGIMTFASLAALNPEEAGGILGWSADRVRQSDVIGQAARLASAEG